jgi:NADH-quinone oxidoreductase subunit L
MRRLQNGFVRSYALSVLAGALLVVLALLAVNLA